MAEPTALVLGVGAGLGASLVRRFRAGGLRVAAAARNSERLATLFAGDTLVSCHGVDATDGAAVAALVEKVERESGPIEVAIANSAAWKIAAVTDLTAEEFTAVWQAGCLPAFHMTKAVAKSMIARGRGTLLFTGSAAQMRAGAGYGAMAVAKSGLRAFSQAAARDLGPKGIHVAHIAIDGPIDSARTRAANSDHNRLVAPDGIAEAYYQLHVQPRAAWSNEIDVRTFAEWL
ncbi:MULTISPECIES: SDR family NAD(P)-dependent oxidoreductase [unclassified Beijerinckia]|uniref:SDR family NAD(P)-dependent oxidoreductase n=1 Tax=unclassified Beijerinckia TaxID=2638183 RepID=UPI00089D0697|nr:MULTISPECIES: SDR family NAD(P)-dependent oxidoreductase [unclassified Beijerinckia]MDH7797647.1 NAD(P)-dependent dehydrogenase (short-subunit alcohol dehydrogenase family) [Beijerinckia sp. GAS462]SEC93621.1 NADP-dependent 3-hydroxy acid dehydrogenase YdfG [Beijerinckia sp. 28-YEA-48]